MRVAYYQPGERVVLTGGLGPLLFEGTSGVMDVQATKTPAGSQLVINYRVAGFARGNGTEMALAVDQVLRDQVERLRAFASKGAQALGAHQRDRPPRRGVAGRLVILVRRSRASARSIAGRASSRRPRSRPALRSARCGRRAARTRRRSPRRRSPTRARSPASASAASTSCATSAPSACQCAIAGQDDVAPPREQPGQAFEGLAPHDHRAAHGQRLEALEVAGDVPRQLVVAADDAVDGARDDDGDRWRPWPVLRLARARRQGKGRAMTPAQAHLVEQLRARFGPKVALTDAGRHRAVADRLARALARRRRRPCSSPTASTRSPRSSRWRASAASR